MKRVIATIELTDNQYEVFQTLAKKDNSDHSDYVQMIVVSMIEADIDWLFGNSPKGRRLHELLEKEEKN